MLPNRVVLAVLLIPTCLALAAENDPDPAALVREVRQEQSWVDRVKSLHLRVQGIMNVPPEGVQSRLEQRKKQFPGTQPTTQIFPELNPRSTDTIEIAFDQRRAAYRVTDFVGAGRLDHRVWDGKQAIDHEKYPNEELYALETTPGKFLDSMMLWLPWPRAGVHAFWWTDPTRRVDEDFVGKPQTFELKGRNKFRGGVECYVLETPMYWRTWYVGVADH